MYRSRGRGRGRGGGSRPYNSRPQYGASRQAPRQDYGYNDRGPARTNYSRGNYSQAPRQRQYVEVEPVSYSRESTYSANVPLRRSRPLPSSVGKAGYGRGREYGLPPPRPARSGARVPLAVTPRYSGPRYDDQTYAPVPRAAPRSLPRMRPRTEVVPRREVRPYDPPKDYPPPPRSKRPRPPPPRPRDERPRKRRDTRLPPPPRDDRKREEERKRLENRKREDARRARERETKKRSKTVETDKKKFKVSPVATKRKEKRNKPQPIVKHDMKLRSVIFASGTPGKGEDHGFLVSRYHNHPAIGCIPRVKVGENRWSFVLEVSEHEKDRRRKYSRQSHRGICKWELFKRDVITVRTVEGVSMTEPGPKLDFTTMKTSMVEGSKAVPITLDDEASEAVEPAAPPDPEVEIKEPESIVVTTPAKEKVEEDVDMFMQEESQDPSEESSGIEDPDPLEGKNIEKMKVVDLRKECVDRGLYDKGLKRELVKRLKDYLEEKRKRIAEQKAKRAEADAAKESAVGEENAEDKPKEKIFEQEEDDGDDVILVENEEPPVVEETTLAAEQEEEPAPPAAAEEETTAAEPMETEEEAAEEEEQAQEQQPPPPSPQEVEVNLEDIPQNLIDVAGLVNELIHVPDADVFIQNLSLVSSWQDSEEDLARYLEDIDSPMSFSQIQGKFVEGTYTSEEEVVADVRLIFTNARKFNQDESEWFVRAQNLDDNFTQLFDELQVERNLVVTDDDGNIKFEDLSDGILKKVIELAGFQHTGVVEKDALAKLAREASEKLEKDEQDVKVVIVQSHRELREEQKKAEAEGEKELQTSPIKDTTTGEEKEKESFFVVLGLDHGLREIHFDRDIVGNSAASKARLLILEFRNDIGKLGFVKGQWDKMLNEGPMKGLETKDLWTEEAFETTVTNLVVESNNFYKKEKKFATVEELVSDNKKLRRSVESLGRRVKDSKEENEKLRELLDQITKISDYRRIVGKTGEF